MHTVTAASLSFAIALSLAAAAPAGLPDAGQQAGPDVDRLSWLSGCWTQPRGNGLVEEQWMAPRGGSMLGMSRTVIGGKTVEYDSSASRSSTACCPTWPSRPGRPRPLFP